MLRQRPAASARAIFLALDRARAAARSLYVHVPFCFHKCHYCDFYSIVDRQDRQEPFVARLLRELAAIAPWAGALDTVFVGGGTPSLLRVDLWQRLLTGLHERFRFGPVAEFTVECNPETVTPELMGVLAAGGVNRVSIGAQSFEARHLRTLERRHDPASVARAVALARGAGITRQSVDLIFGIPGQTVGEWEADLGAALALGTNHLSCYDLTYEPATALTARRDRGEVTPADEDVEIEMFAVTLGATRAAGLARYEVSNYARPGDECRHNLAYWRQEQWLAAGPSASGHLAGHRWKNTPRLDDYLSIDDGGFAPIADHEPPEPVRAIRERIMTGLRLTEGLDARATLASVRAECGHTRAAALASRAEWHRASGHLIEDAGRWVLTESGFLLADGIASDLMGAVD
ncbi:MAG: radical SAM family heme chaperone HemW [Phycisphaerales bacterium]|nr:radical SAM family heme chaperone HemW [Phycisphaerales bacterium]